MSLYDQSVPQLKKMLENLDRWLEKAVEFAKTKSFDPNVLLTARLAPDQFPLLRQIQAACDAAKAGAARLTGKPPPSHPDTEQNLDEIRQRIKKVVSYLDTFSVQDFEGSDTRPVELPFLENNKVILGSDYLTEMVLPNFYFHVTSAYSILRHNGVDLGKRDYLGSLKIRDR
jgi:uncharacterized protein